MALANENYLKVPGIYGFDEIEKKLTPINCYTPKPISFVWE